MRIPPIASDCIRLHQLNSRNVSITHRINGTCTCTDPMKIQVQLGTQTPIKDMTSSIALYTSSVWASWLTRDFDLRCIRHSSDMLIRSLPDILCTAYLPTFFAARCPHRQVLFSFMPCVEWSHIRRHRRH